MTNQRGLSLVELLVGVAAAVAVLGGIWSFYVATTRALVESTGQAALQRQGSLVLDEIAHQVRRAIGPNAIVSPVICKGIANSVQINVPPPPPASICYYGGARGELCEIRDGGACGNLLNTGLTNIVLMTQTDPADPRCPAEVPVNAPCFRLKPNDFNPRQIDVAFAIRDADRDSTGAGGMAFSISLTCSGRNC